MRSPCVDSRAGRAANVGLAFVAAIVLRPALPACAEELAEQLKTVPYRIVYETHRDDNWELFMVDADGSHPVNLTRTPEVNEIYPHVSPRGDKLSFLVDEGQGESTVRSAYYMNLDGTGRKLIGKDIRWSCWNADGTVIAYLKNEPGPFSYKDGTTKGLFFYDPATGRHEQHPNEEIYHIYNVCWSPDGNWLLATVSGGMGYKHANLALEAHGMGVFDLGLRGCRPDISPDGKEVAWGRGDWTIRVVDLDLGGPEPKTSGGRDVVTSSDPMMVYHVDWSPDGKYVAFCRGPRRKGMGLAPPYLGAKAEGWNICVADATALNRWVAITSDGKWNKEPDWVPVRRDEP
jgi:Tol biopolymer transport system component